MAKRKGISKKTRFEVFKRDSFTCQYCGRSAPEVVLHVDHIQPVSKEGEDDILNLITSCFDCNMGKKDRLISDDSVIAKQKAQLDELSERREQLEMMIQWREGMRDLGDIAIDAFANEWDQAAGGYSLNDSGLLTARKLINKYGLPLCLDAIQRSVTYLETDHRGKITKDSAELAFTKIPGILKTLSYPEWKQKLLHIRNTACMGKDWAPSTKGMALQQFERAYKAGASLDDLMDVARERLNFNELWDVLQDRIDWE